MNVVILVLSDRCDQGTAVDASGPALANWLTERGCNVASVHILPDEQGRITTQLTTWCDAGEHDVVLTCGGTGVSPRDLTPEATRAVITRELPGFGEAMRAASLKATPHAVISRALAGVRGQTLIINLPGSPRAALENLSAIWPAVPHCVAKIQGDDSPCAAP